MPLQVAKQDISKPTQRMLTLHTVASTMANWVLSTKKTGQGKISLRIQNRILELLPVPKYRFQWTYPIVFTTQKECMLLLRLYTWQKIKVIHLKVLIYPNDPKLQEKRTNNWIKQEQKYTLRYSPSQNHR
jgi:hypothetical protein